MKQVDMGLPRGIKGEAGAGRLTEIEEVGAEKGEEEDVEIEAMTVIRLIAGVAVEEMREGCWNEDQMKKGQNVNIEITS